MGAIGATAAIAPVAPIAAIGAIAAIAARVAIACIAHAYLCIPHAPPTQNLLRFMHNPFIVHAYQRIVNALSTHNL